MVQLGLPYTFIMPQLSYTGLLPQCLRRTQSCKRVTATHTTSHPTYGKHTQLNEIWDMHTATVAVERA